MSARCTWERSRIQLVTNTPAAYMFTALDTIPDTTPETVAKCAQKIVVKRFSPVRFFAAEFVYLIILYSAKLLMSWNTTSKVDSDD